MSARLVLRSYRVYRTLLVLLFSVSLVAEPLMAARPGLRVISEPQGSPELALKDDAGRLHRIADYRGRPVIVNFWASWCSPCREEMPSLQATKRAFSEEGLMVLAVSLDGSWDAMAEALKGYESDFVALLDEDGQTAARWGAVAVPTAFVLDRAGRIRLKVIGGYDWEAPELREHIERLP